MPKLLVIDDEPHIRFSIGEVFADDEIEVVAAETVEEGLRLARDQSPDVVLLDIKLGNRSGLDVFRDLRRIDPQCLVIFITGFGTAETAIEAMTLGAYDYLVKPLDAGALHRLVKQAVGVSRFMHVPAILEEGHGPEYQADLIIGRGAAMQAVCKQIGRVASQDVNVLILGESGTGKELAARAIYQHSQRREFPFLAINCAAIPETLLESELFGHERGAFTGADRQRIGKFEQCNGGTLFLDEIGDMSLKSQAKVLRLLQESHFERVGGTETISVSVRILAATNHDLNGLIEKEQFRKDLYYRLRGVTLELPPLREHPDDIPELAHYFLFRYNRQFGMRVQSISAETMELLERYAWPGNVRQLQSVIRESLLVASGLTLLPEFLPVEIRTAAESEPVAVEQPGAPPDMDWENLFQFVENSMSRGELDVYRRAREHFDRLLILRAMRVAKGNQNRAAEILGLSRVTLRARLRAMQLAVGKVVTEGESPSSAPN